MPLLKATFNKEDHIQGDPNAPIIMVEYGDFQCPYCGAAYPVIKKLQSKFKNQMALVFRHFPLSQIHEYARIAAFSAEAAAKQGKFWEMHNLIFENQDKLNSVFLLHLAERLDLNMKNFQKDISDPAIVKKVDLDFQNGILSGVNGTPTFYINGLMFNGPYDFESLALAMRNTVRTDLVSR